MRMGCWIKFRGNRRFVIGVRSSGLLLLRLHANPHLSPSVFYSTGSVERAAVKVLTASTPRARTRARRMLESDLQPWTTITWNGDQPTYVHHPEKRK